MIVATDSEGRCIHHPFVQLQRLSHRTGEWKALLDSCPLCVMDDKSVASSVCSSAIVLVRDDNPLVASSRRGRGRSTSISASASAASVTSTSSEAASEAASTAVSPSFENVLASLSSHSSSARRSARSSARRSARRSRPRSTSRVRFGDGASNASVSSSASLPGNSSNSNLLLGLLSDNNGGNQFYGYGGSGSSSQSVSSTTGTGEPLSSTKSVLKTLPRYKACRVKMQRQLSEIEKVTTMSMDMSMEFSIHDGENYDFGENFGGEGRHRQKQDEEDATRANANEEVSVVSIVSIASASIGNSHCSEKSHGSDRSKEGRSRSERLSNTSGITSGNTSGGRQSRMDKKLQKISSRPQPHPHPEEKSRQKTSRRQTSRTASGLNDGQDSKNTTTRDKKSNDAKKDAKKKTSKRPDMPRPDPEEFPCNISQGSHDRSNRSSRQQQQQRRRPQRFTGRVTSSFSSANQHNASQGSHDQSSRRKQRSNSRVPSSFSSANQHYNSGELLPPPPLPQQQQHNNINMSSLHVIQPTRQQPCYANMVVNPSPNYDDEVSNLSFMGNSVGSSYKGTPLGRPSLDNNDQKNATATTPANNAIQNRDVNEAQATNKTLAQQPLLANNMINTNDYDSKGRCVHHTHIRLRKKKLFGRGWKVLMSACPDCCVDELRRIRLVEQNNKKRIMKQKLDHGRNAVALGNNSDEVGLDSSHRSGGSRSSSHRSNQNMVQSVESVGSADNGNGSHLQQQSPQRQQQQQQQSSSFHSTGSSNNATPKTSATAAPCPPPRHRSSFHITGSSNIISAAPKPSAMAAPPPSSPNPPPPPPRSSKRLPSKETLSRRSPSQESFQRQRHNMPPPTGQPSMTSKRSPSQESFRDASTSLTNAHHRIVARRSPSQDSFRDASSNIVNAKKDDARRSSSNNDDATASLTSDEQISDSDRSSSTNTNGNTIPLTAHKLEHVNLSLHRNHQRVVPSSSSDSNSKIQDGTAQKKKKKTTKSSRSKSKERQQKRKDASHQEPSQKQQQRGTIHVRQMQWTDTKGLSGMYTGQVNDGFVPSGCGTMEYATGSVKEGEWKNGRYRKSISGDKGGGHASSGGGASGRSRATSREGGRSRSRSRSTGRRQRSSSRSIRPQQAMPVAA